MKDIRILTLYKDNFSMSPFHYSTTNNEDENNSSKYASFSQYRMIEISSLGEYNTNTPNQVYKTIQQKRIDSNSNPLRLLQSIVILGDNPDFWKDNPDFLYITMLKLTNDDFPEDHIKKHISYIFKSIGLNNTNWTLYHSLDFTDLILFTKNCRASDYEKITWQLTSEAPTSYKRYIRDALTICVYSMTMVQNAFNLFKETKYDDYYFNTLNDMGSFSLELKINFQSPYSWIKLSKTLTEPNILNITFTKYRLPGRYDIGLLFDNCNLQKMLYIMYCLYISDIQNDDANKIGGYIAYPIIRNSNETMTDYYSNVYMNTWYIPLITYMNSEIKIIENAEKKLLGKLKDEIPKDQTTTVTTYLNEVFYTINKALKNGFTEEYILSILEPYLVFIDIIKKELTTNEYNIDKLSSCYSYVCYLMRKFAASLNLVTVSTMHNDREFIQAPSFSPKIFDIPPKLLAYYTAITHKIISILTDKSEKDRHQHFSYLFNPDFRSDVHVSPITSQNKKISNLSVIYLNESTFYQPDLVIPVLCHEIAHQVGSEERYRQSRFIHIIKSIVVYLFNKIFKPTINDTNLITYELIAESIASTIIPQYSYDDMYYLQDVKQFIYESNCCMNYISGEHNQDEFADNVSDKIYSLYKKLSSPDQEIIIDNYKHICRELLSSSYIDSLSSLSEKAAIHTAGRIIYNYFSLKLKETLEYNSPLKSQIQDYVEALTEAYSEVYADLRMIELMGISRFEDYDKIMKKIGGYKESENDIASIKLRRDALSYILNQQNDNPCIDLSGELYIVYSEKELIQYADSCRSLSLENNIKDNPLFPKGLQSLKNIKKTIHNYPSEIIKRYLENLD